VRRLVALDLPAGADFVAALRRAWDAGDAVLPVDQRLPAPARESLLAAARPHVVVGEAGASAPDPTWPAPVELEAGDALVVATSGSTGAPKLVVHTVESLTAHAQAVHHRLSVDPTADRWLACLPLNHLGGFGVVARALLTGVHFDVIDSFDAAEVSAAPRRLGATLVSLVPTALDRIDPAGFRAVVLGGASDERARPANVVRTYGLTETGGGVVYDGVALAGVEVRIDPGGAISVRSPTTARGRRRRDGSVEPLDADGGWLHTGDLGRWNDGRLVVEGRADELIVTGGENVWPQPVEDVLRTHRAIADAAVVGVADPEWGQRLEALVVIAAGAQVPSLPEVRAHVLAHLPPAAAPKAITVVSELPRSSLGKLRRRDLPPAQRRAQ
jgi:O-succinylbenzoic acid--CoA ligase